MRDVQTLVGLAAAIVIATGCVAEGEEPVEGQLAGECSDEADNDGDGLFDCDDPDCFASPACDPTGVPPGAWTGGSTGGSTGASTGTPTGTTPATATGATTGTTTGTTAGTTTGTTPGTTTGTTPGTTTGTTPGTTTGTTPGTTTLTTTTTTTAGTTTGMSTGTTRTGALTAVGSAVVSGSFVGAEDLLFEDSVSGALLCHIAYDLVSIGPRYDCAGCAFAYDVEIQNPTVVLETAHCVAVGMTTSDAAAMAGTTVHRGYDDSYVGHAQVLMTYDGLGWVAASFADWDPATYGFGYEWLQGVYAY